MMDKPMNLTLKNSEYHKHLIRLLDPDKAGSKLREVVTDIRDALAGCIKDGCSFVEYAGFLWECGDGPESTDIDGALLELSEKYPELTFQHTNLEVNFSVAASNDIVVIYFHDGAYQDFPQYQPLPTAGAWTKIA